MTLPMVAVAVGILIGPLAFDISHLDAENEVVRLLVEFTLALVLFCDASRINLARLKAHLGLLVRLLGLGLVATIFLGFAVGVPILGGDAEASLGLWEIALLAALLAPTDAALGQAVVTQESVPMDVRTALHVESGLSDGLIVPVVAALMACSIGASTHDSSWLSWVGHALEEIGYGVVPGVAIGWVAAKLLDAATTHDWMEEGPSQVAVAAIPVGAFFGAEMIGGSGFLAAFVAGLAAGATVRSLPKSAYEFTESSSGMMGIVTWTVFGIAAAPVALHCATAPVILYSLLCLTVVRMVPVALALAGTGLPMSSKLFSVLFHGLTAGWLARRYGASVSAR